MQDWIKFKTPGQMLSDYPILAKAGWSACDIGMLYRLRLVNGYKRYGHALVDPGDVLRLFYFRFPQYLKY